MKVLKMTTDGPAGVQSVPAPGIVLSGAPSSQLWPVVDRAEGALRCGQWIGEPGEMRIRPRPHHEMFTVLSGLVEVEDDGGNITHVGPGEAAFIPQGFSGIWRTIEKTQKTYILLSGDPTTTIV